jgi:hypothetical protein
MLKAYSRIVGRGPVTCVLFYTSVKASLLVYVNGPETLISVVVCLVKMRFFVFDIFFIWKRIAHAQVTFV